GDRWLIVMFPNAAGWQVSAAVRTSEAFASAARCRVFPINSCHSWTSLREPGSLRHLLGLTGSLSGLSVALQTILSTKSRSGGTQAENLQRVISRAPFRSVRKNCLTLPDGSGSIR